MTRISEIHGIRTIPADEIADRSAQVKTDAYIPYLSLTKGEMQLMLAAQRAQMLAQYYSSDAPEYRQAAAMLNKALIADLHRSSGAISGPVPDELQGVARLISTARYRTAPASSAFFYRPAGVKGIGQIIPAQQRLQECLKGARNPAQIVKCQRNFKIEEIYNGAIENSAHHVVYHKISETYKMPERVYTKLLLQTSGIQGMAAVSHLDNALMAGWVENGIMAKNATLGIGPVDSLQSSFALAPNGQAAYNKYIAYATSKGKWTGQISGIGALPAVAIIIGAITSALIAVKGLIEALRQQQATIKAEGFGTEAYSGKQSDWDSQEVQNDNTLLYIALAAAGVYLLSEN